MSKLRIKKYYHRKLVRDKIPELIESAGDTFKSRIVSVNEYKKLLRKKLIEESNELFKSDRKNLVKELADVLQLIIGIADSENISFKKIEAERKRREKNRGVFKKRIFLVWSNKPSN